MADTPEDRPEPDATDLDDNAATQRYLEMVRAMHEEWDTLEAKGDASVQMSGGALATIKESVRADVRHGAHVEMPPTDVGPYTLTELALRTLVRTSVDSVPGALALRTSFDYDAGHGLVRGRPLRASCRISAHLRTPDLPALAEQVRTTVRTACARHLAIGDIAVDIHIEDLHEHAAP